MSVDIYNYVQTMDYVLSNLQIENKMSNISILKKKYDKNNIEFETRFVVQQTSS